MPVVVAITGAAVIAHAGRTPAQNVSGAPSPSVTVQTDAYVTQLDDFPVPGWRQWLTARQVVTSSAVSFFLGRSSVMFGLEHAWGVRGIVIAVLPGWLVSWLGVAPLMSG